MLVPGDLIELDVEGDSWVLLVATGEIIFSLVIHKLLIGGKVPLSLLK